MHEWLSGGVALLVAVVLSVRWLVSQYAKSQVKSRESDIDTHQLIERVTSLEKDVRDIAHANLELSNAFHAEINKILHKLAGGTDG